MHRHPLRVRFGDCDPAGIVYFPRFFDWFHQAMEGWFDQTLQAPYGPLIRSGVGFPAVRTQADYKRPCRLGEDLVIELRVGRLGRSSMTLDYRVVGEDGLKATGQTVVVCAEMLGEGVKARSFPADLRARIEAFQAG